ncbi:MAG: tetratricopeptide repeat protein [Chloroflexi bacterium]|nr:tetratricopeptide repeat protein [Chloroflexota bacterium]
MRDFFKPAVLLKIFLPIVIVPGFGLSPRPIAVDKALQLSGGRTQVSAQLNLARLFEQAAQAIPWRADLWERAGSEALQAGNYASAEQSFQKAASLGRLSIAGQESLGDAYAAQGDLNTAVSVWNRQAVEGHASPELYEKLAQAQLTQGDLSAATNDLQKGLAFYPDSASLAYHYGLYAALVNPQAGLKALLKTEALDPQRSAAIKTMQTGINLASRQEDKAYGYLIIGRSLGSIGEWELASRAFNLSTQSNPAYAEAWAFLGEAQQELKKDGYPALNRALSLNPHSVLVQALFAMYWQRQGKTDLALVNLHSAADLEPDNPVWQVALGEAIASLGDVNEALPYYQKAASLAPQDAYYWRLLAVFSAQNMVQMREVGLPAARQALSLGEDDPASLDTMSQIFLALDDLSSAERFCMRALDENANYQPALLHLAMAYIRGGKTSQAYPLLVKAADAGSDPDASQSASRLLKIYFP